MITKPLKWYGGKQRLAVWIIEHFPDRDVYTRYSEAFAGGLGVLFKHDPNGKSETVNDINRELTNFWQVLQCPEMSKDLIRRLSFTALSEIEWEQAYMADGHVSKVDRACNFFIRYRQSFNGRGGEFCFPTKRCGHMNENVSSWLSAVDGLPFFHERLRRVEIRNMAGIDFIRKYDHPNVLHYVDPPYLPSARVRKAAYEYEMSEQQHIELLDCLANISGRVLLSGYRSDLYDSFLTEKRGFRSVEKTVGNAASRQKKKPKMKEVLWMNY